MITFERKIALSRLLARAAAMGRAVTRRVGLSPRVVSTPSSQFDIEAKEAWLRSEIVRELPTNANLRRVEIIILTYNVPDMEGEAVRRIVANTDWPYKIVLFDNRPGTKNMSKVWNQLIRESTCDYLIIMDSDVLVPRLSPCWLTRLMSTFDDHTNCAVVTPKVTRTSATAQRATQAVDSPAERLSTEFAGMCTLYRKDIFGEVGYFDEDFLLYGSDSEWAERLLRSPHGAYVRPDVVVDHIAHYSTKRANATESTSYDYAYEREYAGELLKKKTSDI